METPIDVQSEETQHDATPEESVTADAPLEEPGDLFDAMERETEEAPETPAEPAQEPKEEPASEDAPEPLTAPEHWPDADREKFNALPRENQEFLLDRYKGMESDYTRKTQEIAEQRRTLEGLAPLGQMLRNDPAFREHVKNYSKPQPEAPQPPDDPVERIKWEAKQEVLKEVRAEFGKRDETAAEKAISDRVTQVREAVTQDPMYNDVQANIEAYVRAQPKAFQEQLWNQLDSDPDAYWETYNFIRGTMTQEKQAENKPPAPVENVQRRETPRAPLLEGAGGDNANAEISKREKVKNLRVRMQGEPTARDIGEWFDLM